MYTAEIGGTTVLVYDNKSRIGGTYIDPADSGGPAGLRGVVRR